MKTIPKGPCSNTASSAYEIQSKKREGGGGEGLKALVHIVCKQMQYLPGFA